jgi:hypothetical protein
MIFKQQVYLNSTTNTGATGSGVIFGFGNSPKTKFSLQATFYSAFTGNQFVNPTGVTPIAPTSADINLQQSNDGSVFATTPIIDWNISTQSNGDIVPSELSGPIEYVQLNWNISNWGTAVLCIITIIALAEEKDA